MYNIGTGAPTRYTHNLISVQQDNLAQATRLTGKMDAFAKQSARDTARMVASMEYLAQEEGRTRHAMTEGFAMVAGGLDEGFAELAHQARAQHEEVIAVLRSPIGTQAREFRDRGMRAWAAGWYDEATAEFERSIELDPYDFTVQLALGDLYQHHRSDPYAARTRYEMAARYAEPVSADDQVMAYVSLADSFGVEGSFTEAYDAARRAFGASPQAPAALWSVGRYSQHAGLDAATAGEYLVHALNADPSLAWVAPSEPIALPETVNAALVSFRDQLEQRAAIEIENFRLHVGAVQELLDGLKSCGKERRHRMVRGEGANGRDWDSHVIFQQLLDNGLSILAHWRAVASRRAIADYLQLLEKLPADHNTYLQICGKWAIDAVPKAEFAQKPMYLEFLTRLQP